MRGQVIAVNFVTSNGVAYTAGDQVGTAMEIAGASELSGLTAFLDTIVVVDKSKQKAATDLFFFNEAPVNAVADNAAADISDAEVLAKCVGVVSIAAADYKDLANSSVAHVDLAEKGMKPKAGKSSLWVLAVTRGTPTYTSVQDLSAKFGFVQG